MKISKRLEAMTTLSCQSAEGFQVQNYGIGGHYGNESFLKKFSIITFIILVLHYDASIKGQTPFELNTGLLFVSFQPNFTLISLIRVIFKQNSI